MTSPPLYPLLLAPALKVKVWGGRGLHTHLGKSLPTDEPYGEAWELHDSAGIVNGVWAGRTVGDALAGWGQALIGAFDPAEGMPLLIKYLDAHDWLSVQVHPDDTHAARLEGEPRGKTEAWYILHAEPAANLVCGVQPGLTADALRACIAAGTLADHLVYAPVQPGDVLLNHAGAIHALGPGILIYEVQQSSDMTYRLYDWDRPDLNGQPRPLHVEKALTVSMLARPPALTHTGDDTSPVVELVACDYFCTHLHQLGADEQIMLPTLGRFHALSCIEGGITVTAGGSEVVCERGQTVLIPAGLADFTFTAGHVPVRVIRSWPG